MDALWNFLHGIPLWIWALLGGLGVGFALEWVIELLWWRGRGSGKSASYELETENQVLKREVQLVRGGSEFQGLQTNLDSALRVKGDLEANLKKGSLELADVNAKFAALQADLGKLQVDHKLKLGEIAMLTAGSAVASIALKGKDTEWGKLKLDWESKLSAKDLELANLKADWEGRLKAKDAEWGKLKLDWESKINAKDLELGKVRADWEAKLKAVDVDAGNSKSMFASLQSDHSGKLTEIAALTAGAAAAALALKNKDAELAKLKADFSLKLGELDTLTATSAVSGAAIKARDVELGKLKTDVNLKLGEIATLTAGAAAAGASIKAKDDELGKLKISLSDINAMLKTRETELGDANIRFANFQADFGKLNGDKARLSVTIQDLQKEIADLRAQLKAAADESMSHKTSFASFKSDFDGLKGDQSSKLTEIAALTAGAVAAAAAIKSKDGELNTLKIRLGELDASLKAKDADAAKLSADWNAKFKLKDGEVATLVAGSTAAGASIKAKDDELGKLKIRLGELEASVKAKDADLAGANTKFSALVGDFDATKTSTTKLDADLKAALGAKADLDAKLKIKDAELAKLTADLDAKFKLNLGEIATLTAGAAAAGISIKAKDDELGKLKIRLGELEASLKAKDADLAGVNTKFSALVGDFDASKSGTSKLDADLKGALGAKADLEVKLKAKEAELAKLIADWTAKLKLKDGEVATLVAGSTAAGASIKAKDDELGKLRLEWEAKLKASADALAKANAEVEAKKGDHGRTLAEIATLTAGAAATAAAIKGKDDELKALRLRIDGLEASLKTKDTDLSGWNTRFMSLQGDFDTFKVTAKSSDDELAKLRARIAGLEDELNKAVYARGTFEASLKSRDLHVADLQAELAKLREAEAAKASQVATFMASANSAGDAIKARERELAEANARFAGLDMSLNDAKWRIGELEAELGKVRGASNDYETRIAGLDKSLKDANWRVGELEGQVGGKDKDVNDLRWRIGELEAELASLRAARMEADGDLNARNTRVGELEAELAELRARPVAVAPAPVAPAAPVMLMKANKGFAEEAASQAGVEVVRTECPQHLSEIDGIGTVFEQRLFEYGIGTFWEVANLDDVEFRKALKLDEIAAASKTGSKMLKIDLGAIRADALRLAKETGTQGRTWLGGNPDDFEPIDGIGHVFELRLYNAGICTYEALIKAGAARLAEICQPPTSKRPARFKAPDYEGWIEQAIELMNKRNKGS